ncbi:MAG: hypothetical protein H6R12_2570 [Proteobacteria bacterium]|jgi:hypothetical protein|nr:hypothetical protein [Pseudomonadota bacterium]
MIEFWPLFAFAVIPLVKEYSLSRKPTRLPAPEVPNGAEARERNLDRPVDYSVALPQGEQDPFPHPGSRHDESFSQ